MSLRLRAVALAFALGGSIAFAGCARDAAGPAPAPANATVPFYAQFPSFVTPLSTVVITVTGAGIPAPLVFNLSLTGGVASGTITLPVGPSRTITVEAVDAGGVVAYRGASTVNVVAGTNPAVAITLVPLTGSVPITATVGAVVLTVTPPTLTLRAGSTGTLTGTITDALGAVVAGTITYASDRPPGALASAAGVVTALDTGVTRIVASAFGATAVSIIAVTPGTTFRSATLTPATVSAAAGGSVTVAIAAADAGLGIDSVQVTLLSPSAATVTCLAVAPSSGTRASGTFACPVSIATGAATGTWTLDTVRLFWTIGATPTATILNAALLAARGVTATLTVTP